MQVDLAFPLIDVPESPNLEWYRAAATMMVMSAREAFKSHDLRIIQMTDEASQAIDGVDLRFAPTAKVERDELMQYRGQCISGWMLQTDRPTILCDVDLLWNTDGILECFTGPDIVLSTRRDPFQPFNGGLIVSKPGQIGFWAKYREMMKVLPLDIRGWWGDQIALAVICGAPEADKTGGIHFGSRVAYAPQQLLAPALKQQPDKLIETPAVHFKGAKRKPWMADYFTMLMQQ